jgi:hypothetical protein
MISACSLQVRTQIPESCVGVSSFVETLCLRPRLEDGVVGKEAIGPEA